MGVFDFLRTKQTQTISRIFSFLNGESAPSAKYRDYLGSYEGWVYTCVRTIADDVASLEFKLQRKTTEGWKDVEEHIALATLYDVNPQQTASEIVFATQAFLELGGDAFWYLPKGSATRKPAEIWTLDPSRITVVKDSKRFVKGYLFKNTRGDEIPLTTDEIIHFKTFNPQNPYRGLGVIQAAALAIDTDTYASKYNRNFFFNSAMPSMTLETEKELTDEQFKRLKEQWNSRYQGTENAHKTAILEAGLKANPISISQKDMQFLEQRKFSRDEILSLFRVPKSLLGLAEDFNRANIEGVEYNFIKHVIKPKQQFIVGRLNEFYLPLFGVKNTEMRFELVDPVPEDSALLLKERESGLKNGYLLINEIREQEGLDPVEGGDVPYLPESLWPLTDLGYKEPISFDDDFGDDDDDEDEEKAVRKSHEKQVEKRVEFIDQQITRAKGKFKNIYDRQKEDLVGKLSGEDKSTKVTKDKADSLVSLLFENWEDWIGLLVDASKDTFRETISEGGRTAVAQTGADISFDLLNPRVLEWLDENALQHAKSINQTVKDEVTLRIMEGVEEGLGASDITKTIEEFFEEESGWRALRVARTEVISGYAEGSMEGYRQSGVVKAKQWLTAGDERVDPHCLLNEQQGPIALNGTFESGAMAPPDHPNCRCVLQPLV